MIISNIWKNKKWQPNHQPVDRWLIPSFIGFQSFNRMVREFATTPASPALPASALPLGTPARARRHCRGRQPGQWCWAVVTRSYPGEEDDTSPSEVNMLRYCTYTYTYTYTCTCTCTYTYTHTYTYTWHIMIHVYLCEHILYIHDRVCVLSLVMLFRYVYVCASVSYFFRPYVLIVINPTRKQEWRKQRMNYMICPFLRFS